MYTRFEFNIIRDIVWVPPTPPLCVPLLDRDIAKSSQGTWPSSYEDCAFIHCILAKYQALQDATLYKKDKQATGPSLDEVSDLCV